MSLTTGAIANPRLVGLPVADARELQSIVASIRQRIVTIEAAVNPPNVASSTQIVVGQVQTVQTLYALIVALTARVKALEDASGATSSDCCIDPGSLAGNIDMLIEELAELRAEISGLGSLDFSIPGNSQYLGLVM